MFLLLLSRFSRVRLCATPETAAHQPPPSLRFSSRVVAGFLSYNGKFRLPLLLAQGSPVFHSSFEGELGPPAPEKLKPAGPVWDTEGVCEGRDVGLGDDDCKKEPTRSKRSPEEL